MTNEIKKILTVKKILQNKFNLLIDVAQFLASDATYHTFHEIRGQSTKRGGEQLISDI